MGQRYLGQRNAETVRWLLEDDNSAVKYLTMTRLLGLRPMTVRASEARKSIPEWGPVKKILDKQLSKGGWDKGATWYLPKYKSTLWQLIVLSQTGIDPAHPKIKRMCDYSFRFQLPSGAFVSGMDARRKDDWGRMAGCLNGNVIASLSRLGFAKDRRIAKAVDHLIGFQEPDGGWTCRTFGYHAKDKHSCFMGTICALEGLIEYSDKVRSQQVEESKTKACEFILMHRLLRADHHDWRMINPSWTQLLSPWLVGYGLIRSLMALTRSGILDDPRMDESIMILESKRTRNGVWCREISWPSNSYASFGKANSCDKWVTLNAMLVLKSIGRASGPSRRLKS